MTHLDHSHQHHKASRRTILSLAALLCASAIGGLPTAARAQDWPSKPIKLVVPYAAGGFADTRARLISEIMAKELGQSVVVENKGGAGGVLGTDTIAKAKDGHTFGFGSPAPLITNPILMAKMPYDAQRDLQPVVLIEEAPLILSVALNQPFNSVAELIEAGQKQPDSLSYGSSGIGGAHHMSAALLANQTNTQFVHVPYKGGAPAAADLMGGHLAFMFEMGYAALPAIKGGKVRPLAVSGLERLKILPEIPTLDEVGIKGFESYNWLGLIAPANTPEPVIERLNAAVNKALADPAVRQAFEDTGGVIVGGSPEQYRQFLDAERQKWGALIKEANISLE